MESTSSNNSKDHQSHTTLKPLYLSEKNMILCNLIATCKQEMENQFLQKPLGDYVERVAYYSGLSKTKINQFIANEIGEIDYENKYFELTHRIEVFKCMADMYASKKIPTIKNVFVILYYLYSNINYTQLQYMLSCLGFEYRTLQCGEEILLEDPKLTFERYLYIKQISELKSKCAPIYYIDEIFIDSTYTFSKPWIKNIDISSDKCDGYVFFHAVSRKGFLNGLFCSPTTKSDFEKWMTHILMPQLNEPSIIVMDNNCLHRSNEKPITKYHSTEDMLKYLRKRNIPCNENLHKAELYRLIDMYLPNEVKSNMDEIVNAHGHQILWLPSTFHDLSITNFLWKYVMEDKSPHKISLHKLKTKLLEILMNIPHQIWENFDENLCKLEKQIYDIDLQAYKAVETKFNFRDK